MFEHLKTSQVHENNVLCSGDGQRERLNFSLLSGLLKPVPFLSAAEKTHFLLLVLQFQIFKIAENILMAIIFLIKQKLVNHIGGYWIVSFEKAPVKKMICQVCCNNIHTLQNNIHHQFVG